MILDDLKAFLIAEELATDEEIQFNYDNLTTNSIVLWVYGSVPTDLGSKPTIQIAVKNTDMLAAQTKIQAIYDALYPKDQFQNAIIINSKTMHIRPNQEPFFNEMDKQNRYVFIFNITVTQDR